MRQFRTRTLLRAPTPAAAASDQLKPFFSGQPTYETVMAIRGVSWVLRNAIASVSSVKVRKGITNRSMNSGNRPTTGGAEVSKSIAPDENNFSEFEMKATHASGSPPGHWRASKSMDNGRLEEGLHGGEGLVHRLWGAVNPNGTNDEDIPPSNRTLAAAVSKLLTVMGQRTDRQIRDSIDDRKDAS